MFCCAHIKVLGVRKGIRPVKNWVVGCWRGCLGWGADLHITQQMPLPLTISCSSKSRLALTFLVLPFWYLLTRVVPDIFQKSSKAVVCVCAHIKVFMCTALYYEQIASNALRYLVCAQDITYNYHTHTHNRFTALWNLSEKTRVSRYQKNIHPLLSS